MKIKLPTIALAALLFLGLPLASSSAYVGISVSIAPPLIPIYEQPYCPAPGYIWTPGYWDYADFGYYWVPGVWVLPPRIGFLWTPGYWGYRGGNYIFNQGYWGPTVGYYGGINYGFGYVGNGYYGGEWVGSTFRYNTAVTRVNTSVIKNTYVNNQALRNATSSRASFNGPNGVQAKPTSRELAAAKAKHLPPTSLQRSRIEAAKKDPAFHAKNNNGNPKPAAIKAFHNNGPKPVAATTSGPARVKQSAVANKAKGRAALAAPRSQPAARVARTREAAPNAIKPTRVKRNAPALKPARAPRAVQRPQVAPRRPRPAAPALRRAPARPAQRQMAPHSRPAKAQRAAPAARGRGPAQGVQPGKKKKNAEEKPGGGH